MTTASLTANNVASMTPDVTFNRLGTTRENAVDFARDNFRHLINRRMRWSECEAFVREAIQRLYVQVNQRSLGNRSMATTVETLVDTVRRAANRRRSYNLVYDALVSSVEAVIVAAERCR